jgi:GNAT superfamily N-acetyltransferase
VFAARTAEAKDAAAAVEVVRRSITELCMADHHGDAETLAKWLSNKTVPTFAAWFSRDDNFCVIAESAGRVVGVGLLHRSGEINLFYLAPGVQRRGIGKAIHATLEERARAWALRGLRLDSTALARPFYEKLGYRPAGARKPSFGVLHVYPYEKTLRS